LLRQMPTMSIGAQYSNLKEENSANIAVEVLIKQNAITHDVKRNPCNHMGN